MPIPVQNKLTIAVLGPGAVGGFIAALFVKKGFAVTCITKESTAKIISISGIRLESKAFGDFTVKPQITTALNFVPDILFITTKSTSLEDAIKRVNPTLVRNTLIIPLLNGIEHIAKLRFIYGKQVIAATIGNVELKKISPGHILHTTVSARIDLASNRAISTDCLKDVSKVISETGIITKVLDSEAEVMWTKLVRLNALACTTSVTNKPIGFIRLDTSWREKLEGCIREAAAVAFAEGVKINPDNVMVQIDALSAELGTSMQRDIIAGNPSEIDAIAGAVIRAGARHAIPCPVIESLIKEINTDK